jgi:hypothetical protein
MRQIHNPTTQKDMVAILINCENCGHCVDLSTPSPTDAPTLTLARQRIATQVKAWLAAPSEAEPVLIRDDNLMFLS